MNATLKIQFHPVPVDRVARRVMSGGVHHAEPQPSQTEQDHLRNVAAEQKPIPTGVRDLRGFRHGHLTAVAMFAHRSRQILKRDGSSRGRKTVTEWIVTCSCGRLQVVSTGQLLSPKSWIKCRSCFCRKKEAA